MYSAIEIVSSKRRRIYKKSLHKHNAIELLFLLPCQFLLSHTVSEQNIATYVIHIEEYGERRYW